MQAVLAGTGLVAQNMHDRLAWVAERLSTITRRGPRPVYHPAVRHLVEDRIDELARDVESLAVWTASRQGSMDVLPDEEAAEVDHRLRNIVGAVHELEDLF